ncbi:MAG TPA: hypothetical protein VLB50_01350 [Ignavibacteriaceae bacterium]|nr:hypothetical protein [Ignavibacteriaceae bacterium]
MDPNSSDNLLGIISGTVQTYSLPYTAIANVEVLWKPGNIISYTNASGNFTIANIKTVDGFLLFRKEGFHTDSIKVNWKGTKKINEQINLNAYPVLDSLSIYTVVINVNDTTSQMYDLVISTKIQDVDNDIDSVFVVNDPSELNKVMDFNAAAKTYQTILTLQELHLNDLEETIGLQFNFRIKNILGETYNLNGGSVTRVIKNRMTGLQPDSNLIINNFPFNLRWDEFFAGYHFHYMVEVYTNDISNPQLVIRQNNISSQETSFTVDSLGTDSYWWVIWTIDDFNNMSRSAPATFVIQ